MSMNVLQAVVGAFVLLAILSLVGVAVPTPSHWLTEWTKWIASVVGIIVSARVLWSGAKFLASRAA